MPEHRLAAGRDLPGDTSADVTIVGAGYTGLWTAYYLARADPALRIRVVDRGEVGAGASGRNGGWLSGLLPIALGKLADRHGRHAAVDLAASDVRQRRRHARRAAARGHRRPQPPTGARSRWPATTPRSDRIRAELAEAAALRVRRGRPPAPRARRTDRDVPRPGRRRPRSWSPHCAAVHPLRLAHGIAHAAQRRGVALHTNTNVVSIGPERVTTEHGEIRSEVVVVATEAATAHLPGRRRQMLPVYSLMVATDPLTRRSVGGDRAG